MALPDIDLIEKVFGPLVDHPIWAASRSYTGAGSEKAPINPRNGEMAKTNDPTTWGPLGEVLAFNRKKFGVGNGALGLMAGPHPVLNPERVAHRPHIFALDVDNGLRDGVPMGWAKAALDPISPDTYIEMSGSRTGAHAFGVVDSILSEFLEPGTCGTSYYPPDAERADPRGKRPAIEASFSLRFMLLTGQVIGIPHPIRNITSKIPLILPRKRKLITPPSSALPIPSADPDGDVASGDVEAAFRSGLTVHERNMVDALLARNADLRNAMLGEDWIDRSAALFASADLAKGYGLTLAQYVATVMVSTGAAASHLRDQKDPMRAIARAWNRSPEPPRMPSVPSVTDDDVVAPATVEVGAAALAALDILEEKVSPPVRGPAKLVSNPPASQSFILADMLPSAPIVFVGAGGQGKTTLLLTMAILGILGYPVWGKEWDGLGRVVYCTKEDDPDEVWARISKILRSLGISDDEWDEKISPRFYLEDGSGMDGTTLVTADRAGNMVFTPYVETLLDRYRGHDIGLMIFDPLNQYGPGESHGNDGAGKVLQAGWKLARQMRGSLEGPNTRGKTCICFISHMSIAAARDEVDDLHAARSAAAFGDNARAVFVLHRHKIDNPKGYVAPSTVSRDAIDEGRVLRLHSAKQSYAFNPLTPFYIERDGFSFKFHDPLTLQQTRELKLTQPPPSTARMIEEKVAAMAALRELILSMPGSFGAAQVRSTASSKIMIQTTAVHSAVPSVLDELAREGKLDKKGEAYSVIKPKVEF